MRGFIEVTEATIPETYVVKPEHSDLGRERTVTIRDENGSYAFDSGETDMPTLVHTETGIRVGESEDIPDKPYRYYKPHFKGYGISDTGREVGVTVYEELPEE